MVIKTIVIALGGNALIRHSQKGTLEEQLANIDETMEQIATLIRDGYEIVLTHGNGPQVGAILIQQAEASKKVPAMPLDVCGAMSQGFIGYIIQKALDNKLKGYKSVTTVVTQVLVDASDPAFRSPTKPVGPFYKDEAPLDGVPHINVPGKGYRKVVASPKPLEIVEKQSITDLVRKGDIVISCGGGGIPVIRKENGHLKGAEAVIEKDLAGELLARAVGADLFVILTDVENVCTGYGTSAERRLSHLTLAEAKRHMAEGQFPEGSMGPKVQAAINFIENGGQAVIITSLANLAQSIKRNAGTYITR